LRKRAQSLGEPRGTVELHKKMTIGSDHERYVQPLAGAAIPFRLLQSGGWRKVFGFGFQNGHGYRLGVRIDLHAKGIVSPAPPAPPRPAVDDLDGADGLLALDQIFSPPALVQSGGRSVWPWYPLR
jgi:hypothetical protein